MRWFGVLALLSVVFVISGLAYAGAGEGNWASYVHYSKAQTLSNLLGFVAHGNLTAGGSYYVYYGYAGGSGTTLPPSEVKKAGPFNLALGKNYAIKFTGSLNNPSVTIEDVSNKMPPTAGMIQIYVQNDIVREGFLGVMLKR